MKKEWGSKKTWKRAHKFLQFLTTLQKREPNDIAAGRTLWDKLNNVGEEMFASFLVNECPQTVAVILSKIKISNASRILTLLPENFAVEVIQRLLDLGTVRKEIMITLESTLRNEFMNNISRGKKRDMHEMVAEIFNSLDRSNETRFLKSLDEKNPEAAERIRTLMFTFEDLIKLNNDGIQVLLRNTDRQRLVIALKGASEEIRSLFTGNMSVRAAKLLEEEMEQMGMVRLRDVEEAQSSIVATAKNLAAQNVIFIASDKDAGDQLIG